MTHQQQKLIFKDIAFKQGFHLLKKELLYLKILNPVTITNKNQADSTSSNRSMGTQQVPFQVKTSPVFLKKPWKLKQSAPYVNTFQAVKPLRLTSLLPATNTPHTAPSSCFFVHQRTSTTRAPRASSQSGSTVFRNNLKYQYLCVTN